MIRRGIHNTAAKCWIHFFPRQGHAYYYMVADCLEYILKYGLEPVGGHSKNGRETGRGYLVPRAAEFVTKLDLPWWVPHWFSDIKTDRELGLWGEKLVYLLVEPEDMIYFVRNRADQFDSVDISINKMNIEIKTEDIVSANLFVQCEEGGHDPLCLVDGSRKFTPMPSFA